ncbi:MULTISPECIES: 3-isopropylmalate dehydratase small subunit [Halolamina]|uniref:3-isopropylmalate dehydratase n=1 Tax=Halolamina pelagica TaxID=699431 RepID=A0A1I5NXB4_9EURY|nr:MULTISPECIES: 3-isopropylmalate dehydratase small subunit [Halolamina]NHX36522.1 3-isopropylmalate dehydratase small subunit [Halolamina sp. R1-12]SFP26413.1 3-isopropylmalate/(R)-2-methylmalate dehydratase small subunit [Halolamina pelagica]
MSAPDGDDAVDAPAVERVTGTGVPVRGNDIDTDQIIPSRFLKVLTFEGLGEFAFFDQRYENTGPDADGGETAESPTDHPFNEEGFQDANVLVVNANFGCGSSREHAPQALQRWGIDAVVGESFAEIFAGNCLALGIPTVTAETEEIEALQDHVETHPDTEITVDVADERVSYADREIDAAVDPAQHQSLVAGEWDTTALLGSNPEQVAETAASLPYTDR